MILDTCLLDKIFPRYATVPSSDELRPMLDKEK
jgi:hypothetical protein